MDEMEDYTLHLLKQAQTAPPFPALSDTTQEQAIIDMDDETQREVQMKLEPQLMVKNELPVLGRTEVTQKMVREEQKVVHTQFYKEGMSVWVSKNGMRFRPPRCYSAPVLSTQRKKYEKQPDPVKQTEKYKQQRVRNKASVQKTRGVFGNRSWTKKELVELVKEKNREIIELKKEFAGLKLQYAKAKGELANWEKIYQNADMNP